MGNIISILQEIFMLKENNSTKVGLSDFRETKSPIENLKEISIKHLKS